MQGIVNPQIGILFPTPPTPLRPHKVSIGRVLKTPIRTWKKCGDIESTTLPIGSFRIWSSSPFQAIYFEEFQFTARTLEELMVLTKASKLGIKITNEEELQRYANMFGIDIINKRTPLVLSIGYVQSCEPVQVVSKTVPEQVGEKVGEKRDSVTVSQEAVMLHKCTEFIKSLLAVKPGEVLGMPNFGSRLWNLLFENINNRLLNDIQQIIKEDLEAICPDIQKSIIVVPDPNDPNVVKCRITLSFESMKTVINVDISSGQVKVL